MGYQEVDGVVTVHAKLTDLGKKYLLTQQSKFEIRFFAPFDDEVDYSLWNVNHDNGSAYYGAAIEAMPVLQPVVSSIFQAKYSLIKEMDRATIRMPIFILQPTAIDLEYIDSEEPLNVTIQNVNEPQMKVILLDATVADISAPGAQIIDVNPLVVQNMIGQSGFSYAKAFICPTNATILVTPLRNETAVAKTTKIIIIGRQTNARAEVPVTVQHNTTIET